MVHLTARSFRQHYNSTKYTDVLKQIRWIFHGILKVEVKINMSVNIGCYIAIFSFTNISSHRWVFRRENTKLLLSKLCRLCNFRHFTLKQPEFLSQSISAQIMSNLRCTEEMYLIIIEITYCICMSKGCICIIVAITYRVTDWRSWKYTKSLFFPPVVWAKSREMNIWPYILLLSILFAL